MKQVSAIALVMCVGTTPALAGSNYKAIVCKPDKGAVIMHTARQHGRDAALKLYWQLHDAGECKTASLHTDHLGRPLDRFANIPWQRHNGSAKWVKNRIVGYWFRQGHPWPEVFKPLS